MNLLQCVQPHAVVRVVVSVVNHALEAPILLSPSPLGATLTYRLRWQSLFIGRRQPLVQDGAPVLYPRYRDISEILLVRGHLRRDPPLLALHPGRMTDSV